MSRSSASWAERKQPNFTFYDAERGAYRPQFWVGDKRSHPFLRRSDGSVVSDVRDVPAAMAEYCRKLVGAALLDPKSEVAALYLSDGAQVIPMPLSPRAPPPSSQPSARAKAKRSAVPGWHGMDVLSIEVDHRLVAELTPDGSAVKIGVTPGTPASKAGLRTSDYVVSAGQRKMVSLRDFDALSLPAGAGILVRFHRPGLHKVGETDLKALTLRRLLGSGKPPPWQAEPRVAFGPRVERDERKEFLAEMARHPGIADLGHRALVRCIHFHDGPLGICPSYKTLAKAMHRSRRTMIRQFQHLSWLGILEPLVGKGIQTEKGPTNLFVVHWPEGWVRGRKGGER